MFRNCSIFRQMLRSRYHRGTWIIDDRDTMAAKDLSFLKALLFFDSKSILNAINMVTCDTHHYLEKTLGALLPIVTEIFGYLGVDFNEQNEVGREFLLINTPSIKHIIYVSNSVMHCRTGILPCIWLHFGVTVLQCFLGVFIFPKKRGIANGR